MTWGKLAAMGGTAATAASDATPAAAAAAASVCWPAAAAQRRGSVDARGLCWVLLRPIPHCRRRGAKAKRCGCYPGDGPLHDDLARGAGAGEGGGVGHRAAEEVGPLSLLAQSAHNHLAHCYAETHPSAQATPLRCLAVAKVIRAVRFVCEAAGCLLKIDGEGEYLRREKARVSA